MYLPQEVARSNDILVHRNVPLVRPITEVDLEVAHFHVGRFATSARHEHNLVLQRIQRAMENSRWLIAQTIGFNLREEHLNPLVELSFEIRLRFLGDRDLALELWEDLFEMSEELAEHGAIIGGKRFHVVHRHDAFCSILRAARELAVNSRLRRMLRIVESEDVNALYEAAESSRNSARDGGWQTQQALVS